MLSAACGRRELVKMCRLLGTFASYVSRVFFSSYKWPYCVRYDGISVIFKFVFTRRTSQDHKTVVEVIDSCQEPILQLLSNHSVQTIIFHSGNQTKNVCIGVCSKSQY